MGRAGELRAAQTAAPVDMAPELPTDLDAYFAGQQIYGDDFTAAQIEAWFADEAQGYAGLLAAADGPYRYGYHALNDWHGFSHLPRGWRAQQVLAFGSAYGHELLPHLGRMQHITLLDAAPQLAPPALQGRAVSCLQAQPSGQIAAPAGSFDLLTCFGVLHHIPNVSFVLGELYRVTAPGGMALVREPITSMGDWRAPRAGLTRRERGFPRQPLAAAIEAAGWQIVRASACQFSPLTKLAHQLRLGVFDKRWLTAVDAALAAAFAWNWRYHRTGLASRFAPGSMFYVLRKAGPVAGQVRPG